MFSGFANPGLHRRGLIAVLCAAAVLAGHLATAEMPPLAGPTIEALPPPDAYEPFVPPSLAAAAPAAPGHVWRWQMAPDGILYSSYLASLNEARMASVISYRSHHGWLFEPILGGRVGLLRYGTRDLIRNQGWQLDVEAAAFPRLDLENEWDVVATDFRAGVPITYAQGPWQFKFGYFHLSSHLGDEYIINENVLERLNYVRDGFVLGTGYFPTPDWRLYGEASWAFKTDDGAEPWHFQFGAEFSPLTSITPSGSPFLAVNAYLREEVDFGGAVSAQTGWQWRRHGGTQLLRMGVQYYNGKSPQFQFFNQFEQLFSFGLWYDY